MSTKLVELSSTKGIVTYGRTEEGGEKDVVRVDFNSLEELMKLLSPKKINEYKEKLGVDTFFVDSVVFYSENEDKTIRNEILVMPEMIYSEVQIDC